MIGFVSLFCRRKRLKLCKFYSGFHDFSNVRFMHKDMTGLRVSARLTESHHLLVPVHSFEHFKQIFFICGYEFMELSFLRYVRSFDVLALQL